MSKIKTVSSRILVIALTAITAISMMSVTAFAAGPYPYTYTVTEANTNTITQSKNTTSSVKHNFISGLPDMRAAVYAVRSNGTSYNATQTAAKYYNIQPGQTQYMYNTVREDGNSRCFLSMSAYSGWAASCSGQWWPDI
ncbi:MAG: hypothetical protein RR063_10470 [Anaerovoracaceae bacterium]